jgi:hypothetical protein
MSTTTEQNKAISGISSAPGTAVNPKRSTTSSHRMLSAIVKRRRVSRLGAFSRSKNSYGRRRRFFPVLFKPSSF